MAIKWGSILGGAAGGMLGGPAGAAFGSQLGGSFDKVEGIPTPVDPTMGEQGIGARQYMDNAFPGTTSWERLGSAASGSTGSAVGNDMESRRAYKLQLADLANRSEIAERSNIASIIAASTPQGAIARDSNLMAYASRGVSGGPDYDTRTKVDRDQVDAKNRNLNADTSLKSANARIAKANARYARDAARLSIMGAIKASDPTKGLASSTAFLGNRGVGI